MPVVRSIVKLTVSKHSGTASIRYRGFSKGLGKGDDRVIYDTIDVPSECTEVDLGICSEPPQSTSYFGITGVTANFTGPQGNSWEVCLGTDIQDQPAMTIVHERVTPRQLPIAEAAPAASATDASWK